MRNTMKLYKLTSSEDTTHNNTKWGENVTHEATGTSVGLCSDGWIHAYVDPHLAVIMNPIHARFIEPHLWEAEGEVSIDDGTKVGCKKLTKTKRIEVPDVSIE